MCVCLHWVGSCFPHKVSLCACVCVCVHNAGGYKVLRWPRWPRTPTPSPLSQRVTAKKTLNPTQKTFSDAPNLANPSQGTPAVWNPKTRFEEV